MEKGSFPLTATVQTFCRFSYLQNLKLQNAGFVSALRIKDGRADLKQRFVATEKLRLERAAGRSLFGLYRNPFTDHPCMLYCNPMLQDAYP